jgi:hypothetical protein
MNDKGTSKFSFKKPAIYKIKVLGDLSESWSERLGGMQINVERSQDKSPVSVLIGQINDQSALSGVLNTLYELHLTIMSVNVLKDEIY